MEHVRRGQGRRGEPGWVKVYQLIQRTFDFLQTLSNRTMSN